MRTIIYHSQHTYTVIYAGHHIESKENDLSLEAGRKKRLFFFQT